ncbi:MAG: YbaB/EbfC family nucleoid-associated protein [Alphaproteobacteria bacterium]|jgi:DNA-binding YbaB/EbfC family protein|nr:YbaB/EbfC family nucleoid-associated protein [Alphaproteobacteria bacterium]
MLNIQGIMKQAQQMQRKMQETQAKLGQEVREGTSGGGAVKVVLNGKSEMQSINIDKSVLSSDDASMLEDLILVAYNDAHKKIDSMMEEGMKEATGGIGLGGLKLPF